MASGKAGGILLGLSTGIFRLITVNSTRRRSLSQNTVIVNLEPQVPANKNSA